MPSPLISVGGVPCTYAEDGSANALSEGYPAEGGATAKMVLRCPWALRGRLAFALRGGISDAGGSPARVAPYAYPENPRLYCLSIESIKGLKPRVDQDGGLGYAEAEVSASFGVPPYQYAANPPYGPNDPSGAAWTTTTIRTSAEVVSPPDGGYYLGPFAPNGTRMDEANVGIVVPDVEITMTRHMLPQLPLAALIAAIGYVNAAPIAFGDYTFDIGRLLLVGAEDEPDCDPFGVPAFKLKYTLLGKTKDWNQVIAADGSLQFLNTSQTGNGVGPYKYADLTALP